MNAVSESLLPLKPAASPKPAPAELDHLYLVVVGHVDHGKSTLIGRLLFDTHSVPDGKAERIAAACAAEGMEFEYAFLMDALLEEQAQNITMDTTRVPFRTERRSFTIIDAPGHKEFLKNMITGAASADAAILLVDAQEGLREQTRRHCFLLSLLGLRQIVVAVNKMDLVQYQPEVFDRIQAELTEFLGKLGVEPANFIPISAKHGEGLLRHRGAGDVGIVQPRDFTFPGTFTFKSGQSIQGFTLRYETYGTLNATRDNAVLVCHALSGDHHCAGWHSETDAKPGWWNNLIGPGKAVDTSRFFVVCANVLGGCQGSTGPSSIDPATGSPYGIRFPFVTVRDMVISQKLLLDHLGVAELHAAIGGSMGGMTAMMFAMEYPQFTRRQVVMASTANESAQAIAFNEVGRQAIMQDTAWNNGEYPKEGGPRVGLAIARMMAHITYLSDAGMDRKFGRKKRESAGGEAYTFDAQFEVESYLRHQGQSFINRFDANSYLYITRAIDQFDPARAAGSLEQAFAPVQAESLVVGFTSDWLFPPEQNRTIALALLRVGKRASYAELATDLGHDSFLLESEELYALLRGFLERNGGYAFDFAI